MTLRTTSGNHDIGNRFNHVVPTSTASGDARQTFMGELINNIQKSDFLTVHNPVFYKIVTPDMIFMFRSKADTTTIIKK